MQKEEDKELILVSIATAIVFTAIVLFAIYSSTLPARQSHAQMEEKCWNMSGELRDDGKCWIDKDGERSVVDLREAK
jgi:hypothetical protein